MIDYNQENKGFICLMYNLQQSRLFWLIVLYALLLKLLIFGFFLDYSFINVAVVKIRFATAMAAFGIGIIFLAPKIFLVKILGYVFTFWSVILGIDYTRRDFSTVTKEDFSLLVPLHEYFAFFTPDFLLHGNSDEINFYLNVNFGFFIVFGAFMLLLLISWFIYNARSSEINKL